MGVTPYTAQPITKITVSRVGQDQEKIAGKRTGEGD